MLQLPTGATVLVKTPRWLRLNHMKTRHSASNFDICLLYVQQIARQLCYWKTEEEEKSQLSASVRHSYHEPIYSAANSSERFVILFDTVHTKFFKPSDIKMMNAYNDLTINTKISYNTIKCTTCQCTWKLCQEHVPFCFSDLTHETAIYVTWLCKEVWKSEWKVYCNRLMHVVFE